MGCQPLKLQLLGEGRSKREMRGIIGHFTYLFGFSRPIQQQRILLRDSTTVNHVILSSSFYPTATFFIFQKLWESVKMKFLYDRLLITVFPEHRKKVFIIHYVFLFVDYIRVIKIYCNEM